MSGECGEGGGFSPLEQGGCIASGSGLGSGHTPSLPRAEGPLASLLGRGGLQPMVVAPGSPGGGTAQDFWLPMPCRRGWQPTTGSHRADATLADVQRWGPCPGQSWDPRSSRAPALQSLSPGSARGCCAAGAGPRGSPPQSSAQSPATVTAGSVVSGDASAVTDWGHVLQS